MVQSKALYDQSISKIIWNSWVDSNDFNIIHEKIDWTLSLDKIHPFPKFPFTK